MSGHSKWAGIKHKKAANDAKRGNIFTKLANNITVAAKQGGGDATLNASLRLAIDKARAANMPKDNIDRAVKRGTGELGGSVVEELLYEAFGPGNVPILIEALTDNRNRSSADIRLIVSKSGGRMAESGVAYQFTQKGVLRMDVSSDSLEEAIMESGAADYNIGDGFTVVYTDIPNLHAVRSSLESSGFAVDSAKIEWVPNSPMEADDVVLEKVIKLLDALDENDDVTNVYTNLA